MAPPIQVASDTGSSDPKADSDLDNDDTLSSFNFDWLFDPDRIDHLPIAEQLERYTKRDLAKVKLYKIATKIWGAPLSRKRYIEAGPMYGDGRLKPIGVSDSSKITADLQPPVKHSYGPSSEVIQQQLAKDKVSNYKSWMDNRKTFRKNLDNMGLNDEYLTRKPNKTELERRVLKKLLVAKHMKPPPTPVR